MNEMDHAIELINATKKVAVICGAGISTLSGIPDFRGINGVYKNTPEDMLSNNTLSEHPDKFFDFYFKTLFTGSDIKPNIVHNNLAYMLNKKNALIITQNIDGLEIDAGCKNVIQIHGTNKTWECTECFTEYDTSVIESMRDIRGVPRCSCSGIVRPNVVLYGDPLDYELLGKAQTWCKDSDLLIILGTTLQVYPVAGLINYYVQEKSNKNIIVINNQEVKIHSTDCNVISIVNELDTTLNYIVGKIV